MPYYRNIASLQARIMSWNYAYNQGPVPLPRQRRGQFAYRPPVPRVRLSLTGFILYRRNP